MERIHSHGEMVRHSPIFGRTRIRQAPSGGAAA